MKENEMIAADRIEAAARLLERGWCQGRTAETMEGEAVSPDDPRAARWCAVGALNASNAYRFGAISLLQRYLGGSIVWWNNHPDRTQAEVVGAFHATAKAIREGKL